MTDARLSTAFPTHPKTKKLLRRLGHAGPWALVCLFLWARVNRANGDLSGMTDEDIELACDWSGDEGALVSALVSVGFVDGGEGERVIHDWAEHQPWSAGAEDRSERARWRALVKHHGRESAAQRMPEYAAKLSIASDSDAASMLVAESSMNDVATLSAPLPSPSPLPRSKAKDIVERASRFDQFWTAYPSKVGKKPSRNLWVSKKLDAVADSILADVEGRKRSDRRWKDGFVPNPATYLGQERWNDGPAHVGGQSEWELREQAAI